MILKYYTYNIANADGEKVGCKVVRVWFFTSPLHVMKYIKQNMTNGYAPVDLRRIK